MITSSTIDDLKSRFRGELIAPGDERYAARAVFDLSHRHICRGKLRRYRNGLTWSDARIRVSAFHSLETWVREDGLTKPLS